MAAAAWSGAGWAGSVRGERVCAVVRCGAGEAGQSPCMVWGVMRKVCGELGEREGYMRRDTQRESDQSHRLASRKQANEGPPTQLLEAEDDVWNPMTRSRCWRGRWRGRFCATRELGSTTTTCCQLGSAANGRAAAAGELL